MPLLGPVVVFQNSGQATNGRFGSVALGAGTTNDLAPALSPPWPFGYGRLDLDTTAGNAIVTGLVAGADGQAVLLTNTGANTLTLNALAAGSAAANQFRYVGDLALPQWATVLAVYYKGTVLKWVLR